MPERCAPEALGGVVDPCQVQLGHRLKQHRKVSRLMPLDALRPCSSPGRVYPQARTGTSSQCARFRTLPAWACTGAGTCPQAAGQWHCSDVWRGVGDTVTTAQQHDRNLSLSRSEALSFSLSLLLSFFSKTRQVMQNTGGSILSKRPTPALTRCNTKKGTGAGTTATAKRQRHYNSQALT